MIEFSKGNLQQRTGSEIIYKSFENLDKRKKKFGIKCFFLTYIWLKHLLRIDKKQTNEKRELGNQNTR